MDKLAEAAGVWDVVGAPCMFPALGRNNPEGPIPTHPLGTIRSDATLPICLGVEESGRYLKHWHYTLTASNCIFNFNWFHTT